LSCIYRKLSKEIIRESAIHSPTVNKWINEKTTQFK
jgi:hypothetical protein